MKNVIYAVIGVVVVGAILWWGISNYHSPSMVTNQMASSTQTSLNTTTPSGNTPVSKPSSISALLAANAPELCTFSNNNQGNIVDGTIYIANGKMRGDFNTNANGKITRTHTIMDASYSYTWIEGSLTGVKTPRTTTSTKITDTIDISDLDNFSCTTGKNAPADFTQFNVPTNITFKTI